jgi:hypothetical protein
MKYYYETFQSPSGGFLCKVYHYDATGNKEILDHQAWGEDEADAVDAALEWAEDNDIEPELV